MTEEHIVKIAGELRINVKQVRVTALLLEEGATVPFIARYRKEATGTLDEVAITSIRDRLSQLAELDKRRDAILKALEERGQLTDELKGKIADAESLTVLEDIYLPYRPKRRTRAIIAREKGLEPLSMRIFEQGAMGPCGGGCQFCQCGKGGKYRRGGACRGAGHYCRDGKRGSDGARKNARTFPEQGRICVKGNRRQGRRGDKVQGLFRLEGTRYQSAVAQDTCHETRGEGGFFDTAPQPPEDEALSLLEMLFVKGKGLPSQQVKMAVHDGYKRLLSLSMETDVRLAMKERAEEEAIKVFADNLRQLLLASPLGQKNVLAIDPGYRTGCKVVCLDKQGKLLHTDTIFPHQSEKATAEAASKIIGFCKQFQTEAIAVGNGTAGRETESFVRSLGLPGSISVIMVNESGASVYSASDVAREEFPDHDVTVRGSVSIGRRLLDPLAELVKIDPKAIGVGQYQHDVDQGALKKSLDDIVISCVNKVGVEVNTASRQLLTYVSGLGPQLAGNIVKYRDENGPFASREELRKVPRLGPKAFEQAAGFLRIRDGKNPLDGSAVHPESYSIVDAMTKDAGLHGWRFDTE